MKTWKEYYLECKDIYQKITKQDTTSTNIYDLGIMVDPFPTNQTYFDQIFSIQKSLSKIYKNKQNYHIRAGGIALCLNDVFIFEEEIKTILENYLNSSYLKDKITLTPPKEIASTSKINTWLSLLAILKNRNPQMFKEILTLIKAKRMGLKTGGMV